MRNKAATSLVESILDISPQDVFVELRHLYLDAAKDLVNGERKGRGRFQDEMAFGLALCEAAEGIQAAMDSMGYDPFYPLD